MAERKITYSLDFKADISDAASQLDKLGHSLNVLASRKLVDGNQFDEAANAALRMKQHLDNALDPKTGKLDLTRLAVSMKNSGDSAKSLGAKFKAAGVDGTKAFMQVANAIANAQPSILKTSALMDGLWTSLKNTAKWQISSAVLSGFTSSLSSAVSFAKELNKSLNDIRIVSGDSADEMARFAKEANKMAKDIGTSTKEIVQGTLIYRQQGDDMELAAKKAEITNKAAAITTESTAQEMSEYLTGIWNSYKVGAKDLELFVDKLAYVGATTATSMEEIATSMTKVAATANTVGVEYEQLLGIISTVSSATRVSAEQVGTAYKTILARMGDLKLEGSIDEDGITTTLGDVSSTLKQVGIDVLDVNGNMRDMGAVIEELGDNWDNFSRAEQTAIANTVAGKRQYTQLFALFENWDKYEASVEGAAKAQGELNREHGIYLESWEASSDRIKANLEDIIMDAYSDEGILTLMDGLAGTLKLLDMIIEGAGGLGAVFLMLGSIGTRVFSQQIGQGLQTAWSNMLILMGKSQSTSEQMRTTFSSVANEMASSLSGGYAQVEQSQSDFISSFLDFSNKYEQHCDKMTASTRGFIEAQKQLKMNAFTKYQNEISEAQGRIVNLGMRKTVNAGSVIAGLQGAEYNNAINTIGRLQQAYKKLGLQFDATSIDSKEMTQVLAQSKMSMSEITNVIELFGEKLGLTDDERENLIADLKAIRDGIIGIDGVKESLNGLGNKLGDLEDRTVSTTEKISHFSSGLMAAASISMQLDNTFKTLTSDTNTVGEKISSLTMTTPMILMSITQITQAMKALGIATKTAMLGFGFIALLPVVISLVEKLHISTEDLVEESKKANEEYEKSKQELDNINNSLEEKKDLLSDITKLEQTPENLKKIDNLQTEIGLLEYKKEILEEINKNKEKEKTEKADNAADSIIENWEKGFSEDAFGVDMVSIEGLRPAIIDTYGQLEADVSSGGTVEKLLNEMENASIEKQKEIQQTIDKIRAKFEEYKLKKEALDILSEESQKNPDNPQAYMGIEGKIRYEEILKEAKARAKKIKLQEEEIELEKKQSKSISTTIEKLKQFDDEFDTANKAIDEFKEKGKLSYDTIVSLQEVFGTADEELQEMYEGLAEGTVSLDEFKNKIAETVEEQLYQKLLTGELNGLNKSMVQSFLESKGVTNAATVAQNAYNLTLAQQEAKVVEVVDKNGNLSESFLTLAKTTKLTEAQLLELAIQEKVLNNTKLDFSEKITELSKYAGAAKLVGLELVGLKKIQDNLVGKGENKRISENYILTEMSGRFVKKSQGEKKNDASDNTYLDTLTGEIIEHSQVQQIILDSILGGNDTTIDLNINGINLTGTPKNDKDNKPETPEAVDWISIRLRDITNRTTGYLEETIEGHESELELLDEEKGDIEKIIQKNNELLFLNRELQQGYKNRLEEQDKLLETTSKYFGYDKDTVLSWFDSEGEQSDIFGNLLEAQGTDIKAREYLQTVWDEIKKIIDEIETAEEGLQETQAKEPELIDKEYQDKIKQIEQNLDLIEYQNDRLEDSPYMDYDMLRMNYSAMQDLYMKQYDLALAAGREAEAREYLAKWWEIEADKRQSILDEFDEYQEKYNRIAEELKERQEEEIELLDKEIQRLQYINTLNQEYTSTLATLRATQHEVDKELKTSMLSQQYLSEAEKEKIFNAKDYLLITKEIAEIEEEIQESYLKYQEEIEDLEDDQLYRAELLTKEYEIQTAEKQRALELLKAEIDLTKKRQALTEALEEKNVRVFQGGQWIQIANYNAVQAAANELAETEYQIAEKKRQNAEAEEKADIELRIAQLEEQKQVHQAEIEAIDEMTKVLEEAKVKWETGFDATAVSAGDLADAFCDAMDTLETEFASLNSRSSSKVRGAGSKSFSSNSRQNVALNTIYSAKKIYEDPNSTATQKQSAAQVAENVRNNNPSDTTIQNTKNQSSSDMEKILGFASGTNDTPAGIAKVNEKGLELYATNSGQFIELNPHGKIFNNEQFDYLYTLSRGKSAMQAQNGISNSMTIEQLNLTLPNVTDTQSFAEGLKHLNEYIKNNKNL